MINLLVIFGGMSTEADISCISAKNVLENLNNKKYKINKVGIDKLGNWYEYRGDLVNIEKNIWFNDKVNLSKVDNIVEYLKKFDIVFPVLHGKYGEDGTMQGLFELFNIKYVGCDSTTSAIAIDKEYSKILANSADIPVVPHYILKMNNKLDINEIHKIIKNKFDYPVIVKPSNGGSSIGTSKVNDIEELKNAIDDAFKLDEKLLIEKCIDAKEIECAILGNYNYIVSNVGEIIPSNEFYDFDAKYKSGKSICKVPAGIEQKEKIREYAKKFAEIINVKGLSRIDFFVDKNTNDIYFNEINTMPGFTSISMYPKLIENYGIKYSDLIDKLIELTDK